MNDLQLLILTEPAKFIENLKEATERSTEELQESYRHTDNFHKYDGVDISWEIVVSEGGREGEGESVERVFKFNVDGQITFIRVTGFYDSYNGTEWENDWTVVYPRDVVVTKYFDTP